MPSVVTETSLTRATQIQLNGVSERAADKNECGCKGGP